MTNMFVMKGITPDLVNTYDCVQCKNSGIKHEVHKDIPGPTTDETSRWGSGLPTTLRKCTACGFEDGPWVSAKLVGNCL